MNFRFLVFLIITYIASNASHSKPYLINNNELCDGFPSLNIETIKGLCVGLVLNDNDTDPSGKFNLLNPRKIIQLPDNGDFIVTDLGQWTKSVGRIWRITKYDNKRYQLELLFNNLDFPHGIAYGHDDLVYVGLKNRIVRFDPFNPKLLENVIIFQEPKYDQLHPLKEFIFDQNNNIIVQQGSLSDHCEEETDQEYCTERNDYGVLLKYSYSGNGKWSKTPKIIAKGLRNSAALLLLPNNKIMAADSSTDYRNDNFAPPDELNIIDEDGDYGWPYYVGNIRHPEWINSNISNHFKTPVQILEPHSTPLGLALVDHNSILRETGILISFHGYEESGAKVSFSPLDNKLTDVSEFSFQEIISGWQRKKDIRSHGAPVGMIQANDGSIWIIDDRNASILRLSSRNKNIEELKNDGE